MAVIWLSNLLKCHVEEGGAEAYEEEQEVQNGEPELVAVSVAAHHPVQRWQDHGQVGHRVPELGHVPADLHRGVSMNAFVRCRCRWLCWYKRR